MKKSNKIWFSLIAGLLAVLLSGCVVQEPLLGGGTTTPSGTPQAPTEEQGESFTVALRYNGAIYVPTFPLVAQWTDGYSIHSASFNETGVASVKGLDGDYRVTLQGLPDGIAYNPNAHVATNRSRDIVIDVYDVIPTKGTGKNLYANIIDLSQMGVYQSLEIKSGTAKVYYQFVPTQAGTYSIETWVDTVENDVNPKLDIYNGSVAYKVFAYTQDNGGSEGVYTKNARFTVQVAKEQIGSVFAFGVKATSKSETYPIKITFALQYNGGFSLSKTQYKMILPTETYRPYDRDVISANGYTFTYPEVAMGEYNMFDGSLYKLNPADGFYHVYDAETDTYGPVLYADITTACRFIDRSFDTIEQDNKALTVSPTECYKLFIEGWAGLEKVGYDTSWQEGLTAEELQKYVTATSYAAYSNKDGRAPVTQELKDFLQKFSVSQLYFMDGDGWVETNPDVSVDAFEEDQWLFACGYYVKNG